MGQAEELDKAERFGEAVKIMALDETVQEPNKYLIALIVIEGCRTVISLIRLLLKK